MEGEYLPGVQQERKDVSQRKCQKSARLENLKYFRKHPQKHLPFPFTHVQYFQPQLHTEVGYLSNYFILMHCKGAGHRLYGCAGRE